MPAIASVDGVVTALADARVPVADRGLLFGDLVFEIARVVRGRVIDGAAHLDRLDAGARALGLAVPPRDRLEAQLAAAIDAAGETDAVARIVWTAGDGAQLRRTGAPPRAIVVIEPWTRGPDAIRLATIAVDRAGRTGALVPASVKTAYLASVLALARAAEAGADDALLVDPDGAALETATATIFAVHRGAITTPAGARLPGVTAARVIALLAQAGVAVAHAALPAAAIAAADELFVTSSRRGVTPVVAVDDRAVPIGPTTRDAIERYDAWLATH